MTEEKITVRNGFTYHNANVWLQDWSGTSPTSKTPGVGSLCVSVSPEDVQRLIEEDWNVKLNRDADPNDLTQYYVPVAVSFKFEHSNDPKLKALTPKITMVVGRRFKKLINSSNITELDLAPVKERIDLSVRPRNWEDRDGNHHVKAYLDWAIVVVPDNQFSSEFDDIPFIGENSADNGPTLGVESDDLPF